MLRNVITSLVYKLPVMYFPYNYDNIIYYINNSLLKQSRIPIKKYHQLSNVVKLHTSNAVEYSVFTCLFHFDQLKTKYLFLF